MENVIRTPEQSEQGEHERLIEEFKAAEGKISKLLEEMDLAIQSYPDRAKGEEIAGRDFGPRITEAYQESRKALDNWLASLGKL